MNDYTEVDTMFEPKIYDILKKAEVTISAVTLEFLHTLKSEDLDKLAKLALFYGSDKYFETMGKAKIQFETQRIKKIAESWKLQTITQVRAKAPDISEILDEELQKIDLSQIERTDEISNDTNQNNNTLDKPSDYSHLNPLRYREGDFFIADIFNNVNIRTDISGLEHPFFALKNGEKKTRKYNHNDNLIVIAPNNEYGMATIFDKDILIFCISKLMQAKYEGKEISRNVRFTTYDFLITTNRDIGGRQYKLLKNSMERLRGTSITTSISTGGITTEKGFGLIDNWEIIKEDKTGRMINLEVTLNEWLFRAIESEEVLKISAEYFRLRKPIDRRIYEIARKHCGNQKFFRISLDVLHKKTGSTSSKIEFRRNIQSLVSTNELPDYLVSYDRPTDTVNFTRRAELDEQALEQKKSNAEKQKKRINSKKQIAISNEFRNQLNQAIKYCPQLRILIADDFIKKCLKEFSQEQILQALTNYKTINVEKINDLNAYFLKMLN